MVKILAVDDEEVCLEIINFVLTSKGFDVISFNRANEAIEFFQEKSNEIDLILLDMMMPEMDGLKVLEKIRQIELTKSTPVIFQTGDSGYAPIDQPHSYIIKKPYKRDDLLKSITLALEKSNVLELI